jgi:hypothetical protein
MNKNVFSQSVGDYRSALNGNWSIASTWEVWNGSAWIHASNPPTGTENIAVDDTVDVDITVNISGYLTLSGIGNIELVTGSINFANGSTYEHARNSGGIPVSTWSTGSTCKITGITTQAPANRNQSFYNLIWNCPNQTGNFNMGFNNVTIGGDISIQNTGASSRWYLCGPVIDSTANVTLLGDLIQTGGQVSSNGTGNSNTTIIIHQYGDVIASNGNFSISRGSQGGTGTTRWYLHGSNFTLSNVTTQNSNAAGAKFIFTGVTQQNMTLSNVIFAGGGFPVEVAANAILNMGISEIGGNGIFTLNDNATLQTSNVAGLDSTIKTTGIITLSSAGKYHFNGSSAQLTGTRLPSTVNELEVSNPAGVTLSHDINVDGNLSILNGDLHLLGHYIDLGATGTLIETPGNTITDQTGSISAMRDLNMPSGNNLGGLGVMFTSTDNFGLTHVERFHSPGTGNGNQGILRQYLIEFLITKDIKQGITVKKDNSLLATTLRFYYDESELNGIPETNLTLFQSLTGANNQWQSMGGTLNSTNNYIEIPNVTNYDFWTLANINAPIPVELTSFTAKANSNNVRLNWTTASETNNSGWKIERKQSDQEWQKLGFVEGSGTSTTAKSYSFVDVNVISGKYLYRLQQVDYDGTFSYSNVIEVEFALTPSEFRLYQNFPNPFNPSTQIRFDVPSSSFINLSVYNLLGEVVASLVNEQVEAGVHSIIFNAESLPSGIYICRLNADKYVSTNKMILIK